MSPLPPYRESFMLTRIRASSTRRFAFRENAAFADQDHEFT